MQQSDYSKAGGLIHQENKHVSFTLTWLKTLKYVYTVWQHTSVWDNNSEAMVYED